MPRWTKAAALLLVCVAAHPAGAVASDWVVEVSMDPMTDARTTAASVEAVNPSLIAPGPGPKLMFLCQNRVLTLAIATGRPALMQIHKGRMRLDRESATPREFAYAAGVFVPVVASPTYSIDRRFAEEAAARIVARALGSLAVEIDGYARDTMVFRMPSDPAGLATVVDACRR